MTGQPQALHPGEPAHRHLPAAVSLNVLSLRRDLRAVEGLNAKVALLLTRVVGTMWAFWAFNGIALVSLPSAVHQHSMTVLINWVSSNWLQLILLPALMVGQNLQAMASDARAARQFQDVEDIKAGQAQMRADQQAMRAAVDGVALVAGDIRAHLAASGGTGAGSE